MGGRQTFRLLIVGKSGSGKSTLAREVMRRMEGRYRHLVIVNRKTEFAELAEGRYRVSEKGDPGPALKRHRRVIGPSPRAWGLHGGGFRQQGANRSIPTCVGTTRACGVWEADPPVHPHVRGDYARELRTRVLGGRSIPTCVGTTRPI